VGSLFPTLKLTHSSTPCGKAAHTLGKTSGTPTGETKSSRQLLSCRTASSGCRSTSTASYRKRRRLPALKGSCLPRPCLLPQHGRTRGCTGNQPHAVLLIPAALALQNGTRCPRTFVIAARHASPAAGHSGAQGNSHRLQHGIFSCPHQTEVDPKLGIHFLDVLCLLAGCPESSFPKPHASTTVGAPGHAGRSDRKLASRMLIFRHHLQRDSPRDHPVIRPDSKTVAANKRQGWEGSGTPLSAAHTLD